MTARVGKPAPEFQTKAYIQGEIKDVSLFRLPRQVGHALFLPRGLHFCLTHRIDGSCRQIQGDDLIGGRDAGHQRGQPLHP